MKIRAWAAWFALVAPLGLGTSAAQADDAALADALRNVLVENAAAYDREDVDGTLGSLASKSPDYETTKGELATQFQDLDVKPELVDFDYIGHDDEFAVARVKTRTVGTPKNDDFADNTVDAIVIFHQENGDWKLWSQHILGVEIAP